MNSRSATHHMPNGYFAVLTVMYVIVYGGRAGSRCLLTSYHSFVDAWTEVQRVFCESRLQLIKGRLSAVQQLFWTYRVVAMIPRLINLQLHHANRIYQAPLHVSYSNSAAVIGTQWKHPQIIPGIFQMREHTPRALRIFVTLLQMLACLCNRAISEAGMGKGRQSIRVFASQIIPAALPILMTRQANRNKNRHDGTYRLHPNRCVGRPPVQLYPVTNGANQQPDSRASDKKYPQCQKGVLNHARGNAVFCHFLMTFWNEIFPRLQAPRHHVQGVAV